MHDHSAIIKKVLEHEAGEAVLRSMSALFKVFGDNTRMRILYALSQSELCVCALCEYLNMDQSAVSHQLRVLKDHRLVASRREGKTVYYALADDHVQSIVCQGYEHVCEDKE